MRTTLKRGVGRGAGLEREERPCGLPARNGGQHGRPLPSAAAARAARGLGLLGADPARDAARRARARARRRRRRVPLVPPVRRGGARALRRRVKIAQKQLDVTLPGQAAIALVVGYDQRAGEEFSDVSRSDTVMLIRADPGTEDDLAALVPARPRRPDLLPEERRRRSAATGSTRRTPRCGPAGHARHRQAPDGTAGQLPDQRSTSTASRRSSTRSAASGWTSTAATTTSTPARRRRTTRTSTSSRATSG